MELKVNGLGLPPFFTEKPNGEYAGFELDAIRIMAEKVNATIKFKKFDYWFDYKYDENGTIELDESGMPIFLGPDAEMFYKRATFSVAEHYYIEDLFFMVDYMHFAFMALVFRAPKPQVLAPTWNLIKPFSQSVWLVVTIALALLMVTYTLFAYGYANVHNEKRKWSWLEHFLYIYMHQLSQGQYQFYGISNKCPYLFIN